MTAPNPGVMSVFRLRSLKPASQVRVQLISVLGFGGVGYFRVEVQLGELGKTSSHEVLDVWGLGFRV